MDTLTVATILSHITRWALPLSIILLIGGAIVDVTKKRFHWSKFALIFLVITIVLLTIQIKLIYSITGNINQSSGESAVNKDEITSSPILIEKLKQANANKSANQQVSFTIRTIHKNNIVESEIHYDPGNGHSLWLYKKDGVWTQLYEGQQEPECNLLESQGIESGVNCVDTTRKDVCGNNGGCYYRTTK